VAIAATGLVVARRQPRNPIGWLLLAIPVGVLLSEASGPYAWLVYRSGRHLPFGLAVLLLRFAWVVLIVAFPLVILLFPTVCCPRRAGDGCCGPTWLPSPACWPAVTSPR